MTFIAIWNCSGTPAWYSRGFNRRIATFRNAVTTAGAEAVQLVGRQNWIFVAPEYAFSNMHGGSDKAAEQVSTALELQFRNAALGLSGVHRPMVCAPGTIPVVEGQRPVRRARNTSYGFFNGAQVWRLDKRRGVGEVDNSGMMVFQSGVGFATANVGGITYGIEICADACNAGTLRVDVERHIILAAGADSEHTHDRSTEMKIIADPGNYGVWHHDAGKVEPYNTVVVDGTDLHYYDA